MILKHHGVKGQKWGVRNGPPYPIEDKVLRKGTRLASVNTSNKKLGEGPHDDRWKYTYNPKDKWDRQVYEGPFSQYLKNRSGKDSKVYRHEYEVVKDLRMPTSKERLDKYIEVFNRNREENARDLEKVQGYIVTSGLVNSGRKIHNKAVMVELDKMQTRQDYKDSFLLLNMAMEDISAFKITQEYAKEMAKNWDAMVDDHNVNTYNDAHDPVIVFNAKDALKEIGDAKVVNDFSIFLNYNSVKSLMTRGGKSVLL